MRCIYVHTPTCWVDRWKLNSLTSKAFFLWHFLSIHSPDSIFEWDRGVLAWDDELQQGGAWESGREGVWLIGRRFALWRNWITWPYFGDWGLRRLRTLPHASWPHCISFSGLLFILANLFHSFNLMLFQGMFGIFLASRHNNLIYCPIGRAGAR